MKEVKFKNTTWISISKPTAKDTEELKTRFPNIHNLILEELVSSTIRPRVEDYNGVLFMVLHFPRFVQKSKKTISHEVDFILLEDTIITIQYDDNTLLEHFWHENKDEAIEDHYARTPLHFLYYLLRGYFSFLVKELDQIQTKIDSIEEKVFADKEKDILKDISLLRKSILDFRRNIKPQQVTLESLVLQGPEIYGSKVKPMLSNLIGEYMKVWILLENHQETLDALYESNNSLLVIKTNETMRTLTLLAFMTFIPMTIAAIFGMNTFGAPFVNNPNAFWEVLGIMASFTIFVYLVLKWRKLV